MSKTQIVYRVAFCLVFWDTTDDLYNVQSPTNNLIYVTSQMDQVGVFEQFVQAKTNLQ